MTQKRGTVAAQVAYAIRRAVALSMSAALGVLALVGFSAIVDSTPASAALLYSCGEDIDFVCAPGSTCIITTDTHNFRPGWARLAIYLNSNGSDPPLNRLTTPQFSSSSTVWIHAQFCTLYYSCNNGNFDTISGYQMLRVMDTAGNPTLVVRGTGTNGQLAIASRTSGGSFTTLVTCPAAFSPQLTQLDLYVNYGTSGEVALYSNSVRVCDFTGNVTNGDGATALNQIEMSAPGSAPGMWSEVIVATTDTRALSRFTAYTNGNGSSTAFSGSNVCTAIWNVNSVNDANYAYTNTSNLIHECTVFSTLPPGSYSVVGVGMSTRALVGATGPQHFNFVVRTGGADYPSADYAPTYNFGNFSNYVLETNPATGLPWTLADLQAAGFNVGLKSKP